MPGLPVRINKYLAEKGYCSRREADELIRKGLVRINGVKAVLGDKVSETDTVEVKKGGGAGPKKLVYLAYNKPIGIVTHSPVEGEQGITDVLDFEEQVFPVGRLDKASHGLIILTNDGRVTDRLLNPERLHEKEYVVKTAMPVKDSFLRRLGRGVKIEDYFTKPATVKPLGQNVFSITLTEGKRHQIRRMCAAAGNDVADLKRVRVMNIRLGSLNSGEYRILKGEELDLFLNQLGLKNSN